MCEIFIVDDNGDDRFLIKTAINRLNPECTLTEFSTGDALYRHAISEQPLVVPDFIILDINLPGHNGLDVLLELRKVEKYKTLPVSIFSTSDREVDMARAKAVGATAYYTKPLHFEGFVSVLGDMLAHVA